MECNNIEALKLLYGTKLLPYVKKVVVWNKLYKKELWNDISYPIQKLHEDEYTTYKILYKSKKIVSTNRYLYGYMQTKNSIMRQEIKQKRIDDNLDAYIQSSNFFKNQNEIEIEMLSRRRFLENCIELAGKVQKGNGKEKEKQLLQITKLYKKHYEESIIEIKKNGTTIEINEIIDLLVQAYENTKDYLNDCYWDKLQDIINK